MKKVLAVAVGIVLTSGCATQSFVVGDGSVQAPKTENMQSFFISGLGQKQEVDAAQVCGGSDKVARVEAEQKFIDGLLGTLSFGIYTPRTARVYCK